MITTSQDKFSHESTSISNFIPLEKIGEGSFSSVYKVRRITDDQIYALKKVNASLCRLKLQLSNKNKSKMLSMKLGSLPREILISLYNIVRLSLIRNSIYFASLWNEGDLQKKIENAKKTMTPIPEEEIWKAAYHTLSGLSVLHSKSILHRDIKSANIFINNGIYKLGDLNVSKVQEQVDHLAYTQTGTPYYASPEVWRDEPYDSKSDIWSLGCVIYEMCTGRPPFKGKDLESLYQQVQRGIYENLPSFYSKELSDFIAGCLRLKPKKRLSCKELLSSRSIRQRFSECEWPIDMEENNDELLKTIQLPSDLKDLKKKLPKSKYSSSTDLGKKSSKNIPIKSAHDLGNGSQGTDYYLQLANRKKQSKTNYTKLERVISEGSQDKNPEEYSQRNMKSGRYQNKSHNLLAKNSKYCERIIEEELARSKDLVKEMSPRSDRSKKNSPSSKMSEIMKLKAEIAESRRKFESDMELEKQRLRKISLDRQSQRSQRSPRSPRSPRENKREPNSLLLLKKLSQNPHSMSKCLSQRYIYDELQLLRERSQEISTERLSRAERMSRNLRSCPKNEELAEIERKVEEKRKELRKIGSIQRLTSNPSKLNQNLSYRPGALLVHPTIKRPALQLSNMLMKSPTSTEDEQISLHLKSKGSPKKLENRLQKVSSTPYIMGIVEAPRMKNILYNLKEVRKNKEETQHNKIKTGSRYGGRY